MKIFKPEMLNTLMRSKKGQEEGGESETGLGQIIGWVLLFLLVVTLGYMMVNSMINQPEQVAGCFTKFGPFA
jgi:hypothetical protein